MLRIIARIVLLGTLAFTVPSQSAFSSSSKHNNYKVGPGDTLTISVFGQEKLSGTYAVDAEGYVQLPVGDPLRIEGLTLQQTQTRLKTRLANGYVINPEVSVRIAEVRPVIIIGAVKRPGTFSFQFGMTVAEVVALAGGFGGEAQSTRSSLPRLVAAKERLALLKQSHRNLLIRLARTDAELSRDERIVVPSQLEQVRDPRVFSMIAHQQALLSKLNDQHQRSLDLLKKQRIRIDVELFALKKERKAAARRTELAKEYLKIKETLKNKGLARGTTVLFAQAAVADKEGRVAQIDGRLSSLSQSIGALELQLFREKSERIRMLTNEKQNMFAKLNEVEISLPLAQRIVELRKQEVGVDAYSKQDVQYKIYLSRRTNPKSERPQVDFLDSVSSGDILEVRVSTPRRADHASTPKGSDKTESQSVAEIGQILPTSGNPSR
jgi:polysaccharide export outer membrane protein